MGEKFRKGLTYTALGIPSFYFTLESYLNGAWAGELVKSFKTSIASGNLLQKGINIFLIDLPSLAYKGIYNSLPEKAHTDLRIAAFIPQNFEDFVGRASVAFLSGWVCYKISKGIVGLDPLGKMVNASKQAGIEALSREK